MSCRQCGSYIGNVADYCFNQVFDGSTVETTTKKVRKGKQYIHTVDNKYITCHRQWMFDNQLISYCCESSDYRYSLVACRDGHLDCLERLYRLDPCPNLTKYMKFARHKHIIDYITELMKKYPDQVYEYNEIESDTDSDMEM